MQPWRAVLVDEALGAAVARNEAIGAVRIQRAAVVVIGLTLDANQTPLVAAVRRAGAAFVFHAGLGAQAGRQIASEAGLAILIDAALHAAMKRCVAPRQTTGAAISVGDTLEANAAL